MADSTGIPRRVRVERGIYRRPNGGFEVGFKDETGRQRWRTVDGGILATRKARDDLATRRTRGEGVVPKPKLRFGEAAECWLTGPVVDLRETTQVKYRCMVNQHLRPRFEGRRLDAVNADHLARLVRELRAEGMSEATIAVILGAVSSIYKFATRRLGWSGTIPTTLMLRSERPRTSQTKRRPIFTGDQLDQTIAAASEPFRTLFIVAALTGARISELCALTWADVRIDDPDDARDRVRVAGRSARQSPADQDRRFRADRSSPTGVGDRPRAAQAGGQILRAGQFRFRDRHRPSGAAAERIPGAPRSTTRCDRIGRSAHIPDPPRARRAR
jgi:integrase